MVGPEQQLQRQFWVLGLLRLSTDAATTEQVMETGTPKQSPDGAPGGRLWNPAVGPFAPCSSLAGQSSEFGIPSRCPFGTG